MCIPQLIVLVKGKMAMAALPTLSFVYGDGMPWSRSNTRRESSARDLLVWPMFGFGVEAEYGHINNNQVN